MTKVQRSSPEAPVARNASRAGDQFRCSGDERTASVAVECVGKETGAPVARPVGERTAIAKFRVPVATAESGGRVMLPRDVIGSVVSRSMAVSPQPSRVASEYPSASASKFESAFERQSQCVASRVSVFVASKCVKRAEGPRSALCGTLLGLRRRGLAGKLGEGLRKRRLGGSSKVSSSESELPASRSISQRRVSVACEFSGSEIESDASQIMSRLRRRARVLN
jgi:hypothetical protein